MAGLLGPLSSGLAQGVLWGIMVLGVYITYKLLDIPDLTADGSFTLGACVTTVAILSGVHPVLATILGMCAGFLAGTVTGILHTVFEIPAILAGILTQIGLWSVNLRIMSGKANNPLLKADTTISFFCGSAGAYPVPGFPSGRRTAGCRRDPCALLVFWNGAWFFASGDRR